MVRRMSTRVVSWPDPPPMETDAPLPVVQQVGESLVVAYVCRNPDFPGWDSGADPSHHGFDIWSAVLRFSGVAWHHFGAPSDEALATHPLYPVGLDFYGFWEVLDSPRVSEGSTLRIGSSHFTTRHWRLSPHPHVSFHDERRERIPMLLYSNTTNPRLSRIALSHHLDTYASIRHLHAYENNT